MGSIAWLGCWTFSAGPLPLPNGHDKHTAGQYPAEEKKKKTVRTGERRRRM
jgi:hypothetical protein